MKILEGKNVIITGASRGIGKGIADKLAQQGANIAFTCRKTNTDTSMLVKTLSDYGVKVKAYSSDASDFDSSIKLVDQVMKDFGGIDVLVNNAGVTKDNLLMRMSEEDFNDVMKINMNSVFNLTKAVVGPMLKQKSGSIINMSSIVGVKGNAGQANYAASKSAIIGFTKSIALELGSRNIRCNAIAPGFIETEMTQTLNQDQVSEWVQSIPLKRTGNVEDIACTTLFLASDMSSYITGQVINVCGGMLT
jgi:3-oxoacyl-[acyl-carrier protein] reductase|tara:strand:+ start:4406 stop:5152 length:747 start_codon:yes stop_codon:yes gene_type:complete